MLTGNYLKTANAFRDESTGEFGISFELTEEGGKIFGAFTAAHADNDVEPYYYLAITLDKEVISSPHIVSAIPEGKGVIQGTFTLEEVQQLAIQLQYGALPIPLKIETVRSVGPSLGQDSVQRSLRAGMVGLGIVLLFMLIYYRLPGLLADLALVMYGLLNLAVFKIGWPALLFIGLVLLISYLVDRTEIWALGLGGLMLAAAIAFGVTGFTGVTLTLPAITGFILSTGMAVDANILVFERMKEELRAGKEPARRDRGRLQPRLDVDPRLEHLDADHLRHPLLLRPSVCRRLGAWLCHHPCVGCDYQPLYRHHGDPHADACAVRLARRKAA